MPSPHLQYSPHGHTHLIDLQTGRVTFVTVRHERIADGQPPVCLCVCVCEEGGNRVSPSTFNAPPLATTSPLTLPTTHHYPTPPHPTPTTSLRYLTSPLRHDPTTPNSVKANLVPVWAPGDWVDGPLLGERDEAGVPLAAHVVQLLLTVVGPARLVHLSLSKVGIRHKQCVPLM